MSTTEEEEKNKRDHIERMKVYVRYSGLGVQIVVIILLGVWVGKWIDRSMGNDFPVITLVLTFLSVFFGMYYLYKKVNSGR